MSEHEHEHGGQDCEPSTVTSSQDKSAWPAWHGLKLEDLDGLNIEQPIIGFASADCGELSNLYRAAASLEGNTASSDSGRRVFAFMADALGMYFKPEERYEPFGPMVAWADGRRSAIPSDLRLHTDVLASIAERSSNSAMKARFADVCWLLDRKRGAMARTAIAAYAAVVMEVDLENLRYGFDASEGVFERDTCAHLRRALFIGLAIGRNKAEDAEVRKLVLSLTKQAATQGHISALLWLSELDLQFSVSNDVYELAVAMEAAIATLTSHENPNFVIDLWRFAARAHFRANRQDDAHRCRLEAAELFVLQAHALRSSSAMTAAHLLSSAIAQLSGAAVHKARRQELRHELIDVQAGVLDEMSTFSHPMDLRELVEETQDRMIKVGLLTKLFILASLTQSPDPKELVRKAKETLQANPFSGLFGASHLDHEGKVIHRTAGAGFGTDNDEAIAAQVAQAEKVRRQLVVAGMIDPARQAIATEHHVPSDELHALLQLSPAIPPFLVGTFSYGFIRFIQGDLLSASYVLIPMLEAMLRHVLKSAGYDPTTFDDVTETQEDRTISSMFSQMRSELDDVFGEALTTDLENVFLKKPGPYLRHAFAHGLISDAAPWNSDTIYGVWLILRISLLPLIAYRNEIEVPEEWLNPPNADLSNI